MGQLEVEKLRQKVSEHGTDKWRKKSSLYRPRQMWKSDPQFTQLPSITYTDHRSPYSPSSPSSQYTPSEIQNYQDQELARNRARALRRYKRQSLQYDTGTSPLEVERNRQASQNSGDPGNQGATPQIIVSPPAEDPASKRERAKTRRRYRRHSYQYDSSSGSQHDSTDNSPGAGKHDKGRGKGQQRHNSNNVLSPTSANYYTNQENQQIANVSQKKVSNATSGALPASSGQPGGRVVSQPPPLSPSHVRSPQASPRGQPSPKSVSDAELAKLLNLTFVNQKFAKENPDLVSDLVSRSRPSTPDRPRGVRRRAYIPEHHKETTRQLEGEELPHSPERPLGNPPQATAGYPDRLGPAVNPAQQRAGRTPGSQPVQAGGGVRRRNYIPEHQRLDAEAKANAHRRYSLQDGPTYGRIEEETSVIPWQSNPPSVTPATQAGAKDKQSVIVPKQQHKTAKQKPKPSGPCDIVFDRSSGVTKIPGARRRHSIQIGDSSVSSFEPLKSPALDTTTKKSSCFAQPEPLHTPVIKASSPKESQLKLPIFSPTYSTSPKTSPKSALSPSQLQRSIAPQRGQPDLTPLSPSINSNLFPSTWRPQTPVSPNPPKSPSQWQPVSPATSTKTAEELPSPAMGVLAASRDNPQPQPDAADGDDGRHTTALFVRRPSISSLTLAKPMYIEGSTTVKSKPVTIHLRRHSVSTEVPAQLRQPPQPVLQGGFQDWQTPRQVPGSMPVTPKDFPQQNHVQAMPTAVPNNPTTSNSAGYLVPVRRYSATATPMYTDAADTRYEAYRRERELGQTRSKPEPKWAAPAGNVGPTNITASAGPVQVSVNSSVPVTMIGRTRGTNSSQFAVWTSGQAMPIQNGVPLTSQTGYRQNTPRGCPGPLVQNISTPARGVPWNAWNQGTARPQNGSMNYSGPPYGMVQSPRRQELSGRQSTGTSAVQSPRQQQKSCFSPLSLDINSPGAKIYGPATGLLKTKDSPFQRQGPQGPAHGTHNERPVVEKPGHPQPQHAQYNGTAPSSGFNYGSNNLPDNPATYNGIESPSTPSTAEENADKWAFNVKNAIAGFERRRDTNTKQSTELGVSYGSPRRSSLDRGSKPISGAPRPIQSSPRVMQSPISNRSPREYATQTSVPMSPADGPRYQLQVENDGDSEKWREVGSQVEGDGDECILRAYISEMSISEVKYDQVADRDN